MTTVKGHFDGHAIVLDEPAALAPGQSVQVVIEDDAQARAERWAYLNDPSRDVSNMTEEELGEWLEIETHRLRGVPYEYRPSVEGPR